MRRSPLMIDSSETIRIIKKTFDRDNLPGLITGTRKTYKVNIPNQCPKCGFMTFNVSNYCGSLFYDCSECHTYWKTSSVKNLQKKMYEEGKM